jgi:SAM-dependent methyltransferase
VTAAEGSSLGETPTPPLAAFAAVDALIDGFLPLQTTAAALQLGLFDHLVATGGDSRANVASALRADPGELGLLLDVLLERGVLDDAGGVVRCGAPALAALAHRDLLEVTTDYACYVGRAMFDWYAAAIRDPRRHQGRLADFFVYDPRHDYPPETREATRKWVRYMSTLTRYTAPLLAEIHDFGASRRLLDCGGNNGECALALCRRFPHLEVTVADLPAVCDLGVENVRAAGLSERISFRRHDLRVGPLPEGFDTILFKSVLHDWGDEDASAFLARAHAALPPGGRVVIFEVERYDLRRERLPDRHVVNIPFLSCMRRREAYVSELARLGFRDVVTRSVPETHFVLVSATR